MPKKALITGITGQDGSYLVDFLISKGYEVHGIVRRSSVFNRQRLTHIQEEGSYTSDTPQKSFFLHYGDLTDSSSIEEIIRRVMPDEIYNLGAQSHVRISFDIPENTSNVVALGTLRIIEAMKKFCPKSRLYQASSSEMFGNVSEVPQNEETKFYPRSPYARAKTFAFWEVVGAREADGLFACNGILFNHESERRGESFVTKKITSSLARIKLGLQKKLMLGNLDAERDWGYAKEYVEAMWLMLQQEKPGDYVVGTGEKHSVREFLEETARVLGLEIKSNGESGINEKYIDKDGNVVVEIDPRYFRPTEVDILLADSSKIKKELGWEPKTKFKDLVKIMAHYDLDLAERELYLRQKGLVGERKNIREIDRCRICGNKMLTPVINLGWQHLSGRFPNVLEEIPMKAPLELVRCDNHSDSSACGLLQLKHTTDLVEMYGESYGYRSGLNKTMSDHLASIAEVAEKLVKIEENDVALDIGSSDGVLLNSYKNPNLLKIGIDPTSKKYLKYYPSDIKLVTDFFSADNYRSAIPEKKAKIITSIAMFYDLDNPLEFVSDIKEILAEDGIWILEQSYMPKMLEVNSFDTICQEHLEYYSLKQIEWMFKKIGLKVFDIDFNGINGGSFRIYACHEESSRQINQKKLDDVREYEENLKLSTNEPYKKFAERVERVQETLRPFLIRERSNNKKIHVYGASTKGNVLLQYFNINETLCEAASDRNEFKWGRRTPGTNIPIISEEDSRKASPDYYLVLPWHFKEEFVKREKEFLEKGGKFIFPLPNPEVMSYENGNIKLTPI